MFRLEAIVLLSLLLLSCALAQLIVANENSFVCHLVWESGASSSKLPSNAIEAHGVGADRKSYVIRAKGHAEGALFIGNYDVDQDKGFIYDGNTRQMHEVSAFEVLTNPAGCDVTWTFDETDRFKVGGEGVFVGRALHGDSFYSGHVVNNVITVVVGEEVVEYDEFQYLSSFNQGLTLSLFNFTMDFDPFSEGSLDFMGQDTIHNNAPAEVNLIVTHKKMVKEITKVTIREEWTSQKTTVVKYQFYLAQSERTSTHRVEEMQEQTFTRTEETEISVSRNVLIKPYQSLQACSVVNMKKGILLPYSAIGHYSGNGMTLQEIAKAVEDVPGIYIKDGQVLVNVEGIVAGDAAVNTKFTVANYGGCDLLRREIKAKNSVH